MNHRLTFLVVTAAILAWTGAAAADSYRAPQAGNPALVAEAPPGWIAKYTSPDEVTISDPTDLAILEISVISDPVLIAKPLADVARAVLARADLSPLWTGTEPETVAGLPGQAFTVDIARDGLPVGLARVILAKIDASHDARLMEITIRKETTREQLTQLKEMVSRLTISGR